jgi:uncharacterized protein
MFSVFRFPFFVKDLILLHRFFSGVALAVLMLVAVPVQGAELSEYGNPMITVRVKGATVLAEVVSSPQKLYLGLSHRDGLPPGRGMLFIMPAAEIQHFCMRGMRFPLDIIWIDADRVVGCERNVQPDDPRTLTSPTPVQYVLEVPAGFCETHRLAPSDPVHFTAPRD